MTITRGWVDWATPEPGPSAKKYSAQNRGLGLCCHSMEGSYSGSLRELMDHAREASWMFSARTSGELVQHYPVTASCWASGNFKANTELWSVELEGMAGTPANAWQILTLLRLAGEFAAATGVRLQRGVNLWEHNEVWDWAAPNSGPTACPSHRYDPFFAALAAEEDDMNESQVRAIVREVLENEVIPLGASRDQITSALVARQRAMGRATTLEQVIKANDPNEVP